MIIRTALAAVAVAALVTPAAAETDTAPAAAAHVLAQQSSAMQARQHLIRQGYVNVSQLERDDTGRWIGTATKDGKNVIVAIDLRAIPAAGANK